MFNSSIFTRRKYVFIEYSFSVASRSGNPQQSEGTITVSNAIVRSVEQSINICGKKEEEGGESKVVIDPNLVQIRATNQELYHRIASFIERKRQQVNIVNVQEFCCHRLVHHYC